jgi:hypothetical protein
MLGRLRGRQQAKDRQQAREEEPCDQSESHEERLQVGLAPKSKYFTAGGASQEKFWEKEQIVRFFLGSPLYFH